MVLEKKILRYTNYKKNIFSHGGDKRSSQILELLQNDSFNVIDFGIDKTDRNAISFYFITKCFFIGIILKLRYWNLIICNIKSIANAGWFYINTFNTLKKYKTDIHVLVWEDTKGISILVPYIAKKLNYIVVAIPHNLESLVYNSDLKFKVKSRQFKSEIKALRLVDCVYTISIEENWLLNLFGINSSYLPYFPPSEYLKYINDVASIREQTQKNNYLILTTFWGATINGIIDLIKVLNEEKLNDNFIIAGFGTNKISEIINLNSNIKLLGEVSIDELKTLMTETKALIINQNTSSGALTRIAEFLTVNIPIIANTTAARSFYNVEGITLYDDYSQLNKIIKDESFSLPHNYIHNYEWNKKFLKVLNSKYYD